ncbi:hypothetical protein BTN60_24665 [Vibrio parahaemolyticus]|nr:hypothetical protein BTN34_24435 [Vibrio parahaemolyticus]OUD67004.1 hypothetical protein BTN60_24665 [Vibrio parahaemolyticus]
MKCWYNKAFKSDSQRLAVSLRSSIAKRRSHLNAALSYKQSKGIGTRNGKSEYSRNKVVCSRQRL